MLEKLNSWARLLKRDIVAIHLAASDPRTPWYAKALAVTVCLYAFSPIDLIPDFIPILGYLDDLILIPLGIALVVRLVPQEIMAEYRDKALAIASRPKSIAGIALIVSIWVLCGIGVTVLWL